MSRFLRCIITKNWLISKVFMLTLVLVMKLCYSEVIFLEKQFTLKRVLFCKLRKDNGQKYWKQPFFLTSSLIKSIQQWPAGRGRVWRGDSTWLTLIRIFEMVKVPSNSSRIPVCKVKELIQLSIFIEKNYFWFFHIKVSNFKRSGLDWSL